MQRNIIGKKDFSDEIKIGTAKLESLLENSVDKNFDKLELYVLRNILSIPVSYTHLDVYKRQVVE